MNLEFFRLTMRGCIVVLVLTVMIAALFFSYKHPLAKTFYPDSVSYINNEIFRPFLYPGFLKLATWGQGKAALALPYVEMEKVFAGAVFLQRLLVVGGYFAVFLMLASFHWVLPLFLLGFIGIGEKFLHLAIFGEYFTYASCILSEGLIYPWLLFSVPLFVAVLHRQRVMDLVVLGLWFWIAASLNPRMIIFGLASLVPFIAILGESRYKRGFEISKLSKSFIPAAVFCAMMLLQCSYNVSKYGVFSPSPISGLASVSMAIQFSNSEDDVRGASPEADKIMQHIYANPRYMPHENENFVNFNIALFTLAYRDVTGNAQDDYVSMNAIATDIVKAYFTKNQNAQKKWLSWYTGFIVPQYANSRIVMLVLSLGISAFSFLWMFRYGRGSFAIPAVLPLVSVVNILLSLGMQGFEPRYTKTGEFWVYICCVLIFGMLIREFPQAWAKLMDRVTSRLPSRYRNRLQPRGL